MGKASNTRITGGAVEKECTYCHAWNPADLKHFAPFKQGVLKLHPWCRNCLRVKLRGKLKQSGKAVRKVFDTPGLPPRQQLPAPPEIEAQLERICSHIFDEPRFKAYLITNMLNGECYVGITERLLRQRWKQHLFDALKEKGYLLHQVMHRDGIENFAFDFVACTRNRHDLHELEKQLIAQYRSVESGYNQTRGGGNGEAVGNEVVVQGRRFISFSSAARYFSIDSDIARQRIKRYGWTLEEALGLASAPKRVTRENLYEIAGTFYHNFSVACEKHNLDESVVRGRLKCGWSAEQAFGLEN